MLVELDSDIAAKAVEAEDKVASMNEKIARMKKYSQVATRSCILC